MRVREKCRVANFVRLQRNGRLSIRYRLKNKLVRSHVSIKKRTKKNDNEICFGKKKFNLNKNNARTVGMQAKKVKFLS